MYPASNGYNSYMDRDEESIGLLKAPPKVTRQLFYTTVALDVVAILLSLLINIIFAVCIIANIAASRAYSYRGIRLKKYPVIGFLTVIIFQGAITYFMVYYGVSEISFIPWKGMLISSLLFGGFYPLTQIYQHEQDYKDGVITISYLLGYTGTFIFTGLMYLAAEALLFFYFNKAQQLNQFYILQLFFLPVIIYFLLWWRKVRQNKMNADFSHTMRMNIIAAVSTNIAFILLLLMNHVAR